MPRTFAAILPTKRIERFVHGWREDLRRIRTRGSFVRNASYTISGTLVTVVGQLLLTPIIARIYGPASYGVYGLYAALVMNLAMVAGLGYPQALVLPRGEARFANLLRLCLLLLLAVVVLSSVVFLLARDRLYERFPGYAMLGPYLHLVPLGVLLAGSLRLMTLWMVRRKEFGASAAIGTGAELGARLFNLVYGLWSKGALHGLVFGDIVARTGALALRIGRMRAAVPSGLWGGLSWRSLRATAYHYRRFPLYQFPASWLTLFGRQIPILLMPITFGAVALGHYALAIGLLLIPLRIFGFSIHGVFLQKMAEVRRERPQELPKLVTRMYLRLMQVGVLPFTAIAFFSDEVFTLVFGQAWTRSGIFTSYLAYFFLFRALSEPMMPIITVLHRERQRLLFELVLLVVGGAAVLAGMFVLRDAGLTVLLFGAVNAVAYLLLLMGILRAAGSPWRPLLLRTVLLVVLAGLLATALRWVLLGDRHPLPGL
jgi:O-antigen/teichoic acid export membrane protein